MVVQACWLVSRSSYRSSAWALSWLFALTACSDPKEQEVAGEKQQHAAFTTPIAFTMPGPNGCPAGYRVEQTACVHEAAERVLGPDVTKAALSAYLRGAAAPRVDLGEASSRTEERAIEQAEPKAPDKLSPGALQAGEKLDPKAVEAQRLRELQQRIDDARARAGLGPGDPSVSNPPPAAALDGVQVEVETDGVKKRLNAADWVDQQRSQR